MCDYAGSFSPPTVTGLNPTAGSSVGGYPVPPTGSGFGTASSPRVAGVQVGSAQAESFSVVDSTTLSVVVPPSSAGTAADSPSPDDGAGPVAIIVRLDNGASSLSSASDVFEYVDESVLPAAIPSVTSVGPSGGLESSPAPVTVYGSGFTGATQVSFGGVKVASFKVKSPYEISLTPPAFSTQTCAPLPTTGVYAGENASNDICQVEVVVQNANGSSPTSTIQPPYEGAISFDAMGAEEAPAGYELTPAPTEYDYMPTPAITSVSTGTLADLAHCISPATAACNAAHLASEAGGPANLITIDGRGMNGLTLYYALIGRPTSENSQTFPVSDTGTSIEVVAPELIKTNQPPSVVPVTVGVRISALGGLSNAGEVVYAGVPKLASVVNPLTGLPGVPDAVTCPSNTPASGCGAPIDITGSGLTQAVSPIAFVDNQTGTGRHAIQLRREERQEDHDPIGGAEPGHRRCRGLQRDRLQLRAGKRRPCHLPAR